MKNYKNYVKIKIILYQWGYTRMKKKFKNHLFSFPLIKNSYKPMLLSENVNCIFWIIVFLISYIHLHSNWWKYFLWQSLITKWFIKSILWMSDLKIEYSLAMFDQASFVITIYQYTKLERKSEISSFPSHINPFNSI